MFENPALETFARESVRLGNLRSALSLLSWDQETLMPRNGAAGRAGALGDLTEVVHRMATSADYEKHLVAAEEAASSSGDPLAEALCRESRRQFDRRRNVPAELAEKIAATASQSQAVWAQARRDDDFAKFLPCLQELLELKREEARAVEPDADPYDTLLGNYEPGCDGATVEKLVNEVKPTLVRLVSEYAEKSQAVPAEFLDSGGFDVDAQAAFGRDIVERMGFDFDCGRIDTSNHPFCSGITLRDVRMTTRYYEDSIESVFSLIHEAGHGLYEQGLDPKWQGTPLASAVSLGIHESQSRLWENIVARGRPFWQFYYPILREHFPGRFDAVDMDTFLRAVNRVRPSLIRVEADEVTYSLHVMLRFELERQLVRGEVEARELPGIWRERMREYLGVEPTDDRDGVLQDIHWSFGAFGYFPTYFLGNLYSAQFYEKAAETIPDLDGKIGQGTLAPLREWLRTEIHLPGTRYSATELCEKVTGRPLDASLYGRYLEQKLAALYD
ncbi:MAG: carboxypeptidase M32 [Planctomycetota bacterium]